MLQIDTGLDFPEVLETRDNWVNRLGVRLEAASVDDAIANGVVVDDGRSSRNRMQTATLLNEQYDSERIRQEEEASSMLKVN